MKIGSLLNGFIRHLRGERNASEHTIEAYVHDIIEFAGWYGIRTNVSTTGKASISTRRAHFR